MWAGAERKSGKVDEQLQGSGCCTPENRRGEGTGQQGGEKEILLESLLQGTGSGRESSEGASDNRDWASPGGRRKAGAAHKAVALAKPSGQIRRSDSRREDLASHSLAAGGPSLRPSVPLRAPALCSGDQVLSPQRPHPPWMAALCSRSQGKTLPPLPLCPTQCPQTPSSPLCRSNLPWGRLGLRGAPANQTEDSAPRMNSPGAGRGALGGRGFLCPARGASLGAASERGRHDGGQPPGGPGPGVCCAPAGAGLCADAAWRGFAPCREAGFRGSGGNRRKPDYGKLPLSPTPPSPANSVHLDLGECPRSLGRDRVRMKVWGGVRWAVVDRSHLTPAPD